MKTQAQPDSASGYASINGIKMYYEIHGQGDPLVLIHGGGSTIQTTFGQVLPYFARKRKVIAVELQAHGRTSDRNAPESFEQDADDVAALVKYLKIEPADFFGFSNGGSTTMQIAIRHPEIVRKIIVGSAFYKREGIPPQFWESIGKATLNDMPKQLRDGYLAVNPDSSGLLNMFNKDRDRMVGYKDWNADMLRSIKAPVFVIANDHDVATLEHTVEMFRLFPHARLSIIPGFHGAYIGEVTTGMEKSKVPELTAAMIEEFLSEPMH